MKKHLEKRRAQGKQEIVRLVGILFILLASIVCIGLKIQTELFISIISLLIGVLLDSPLSINGGRIEHSRG